MQTSDRVAIVTGASRGIGREIAIALAKDGFNVVIAAKSTEPQPTLPGTIYTVADEIRAVGRRALPVQMDVRKDEDVQRMVNKTIEEFGRVDVLICNSGALWWKPVSETPMSRYDLVHSVNSRGAFSCVRAVLPHMLRQNHGRIVVMSPPVDLSLVPGKVAYCISKFGMTMLAMGLGEEVKGTDVSICALWPATLIESYATINFEMGNRQDWRKASILADCVTLLVNERDASATSGRALIDEEYLHSRGVTDLRVYRYDPAVEPRKAWPPRVGIENAQRRAAGKVPSGVGVPSSKL